MSLSGRTQQILAVGLADNTAAQDLVNAIAAAAAGTGTDPSVSTLTTTGNATIGGTCHISGNSTLGGTCAVSGAATIGGTTTASDHILLATGKVLKVNSTQVVGAQQGAVNTLTVAAGTGSLPVADGSITVADAATPTVAELLEFCVEVNARLNLYRTALRAHGLIA